MSSGIDPTLIPIFEAEVAEIVGTLQAHLLRLEQGAPGAPAVLADMLRLTHDVKGSARVVGYQRVSHLAHAFESRLLRWRGLETAVPPAEIGLALAACDQLSQLTLGRESPELVARAAELAQVLENGADASGFAVTAPAGQPADGSASAPHAPDAASMTGGAPARPRALAMRVVQASESLRVSRARIESVVDAVANSLLSVLAGADRLAELQRASRELQNVRPPRDGATPREIARARGEMQAASQRVRSAVARMADALRPLDRDIRIVDERARDLCLVPFTPVATHLERVARDTAALLGRELVFTVEGRDSHIDKALADAVKGPLTHAVRNAVDHGIEPPDERERAGKPRAGSLTLSLLEDGQSLRLTLRDDGRGIDRTAVRRRLGASSEGLDDEELLATLLRAGVSTRETVTEISGRGVGLSSLAAVAEELRGDARLRSEPQLGTTLELRLPLKLSLLRGLLVRAGGCSFILPADALVSVRTPSSTAVPLAQVLGLPGTDGGNEHGGASGEETVMLRGRHGHAGLFVDRIETMREVVRRPLGAHLGRAPFVEGVTVLPDGEPALILDARELAEACPQAAPPAADEVGTPQPAARRVLLVDDSLTLRASLNHSLLAAGFEVLQAADGLAALELLGRTSCDAIVSDVQMPRMDGWQLLQHCSGGVPFVLMTARPEPDGSARAHNSGACAYLAKDDTLGERVIAVLHTALSQLQESHP